MSPFLRHRRRAFRVAPVSLPTDNLFAHYDADATVIKDGGNAVSQWTDMSGNANHITQATGTKQPVWSDSVINGYPAIAFDGSDDYLKSSAFSTENNATVCVVIRKHTTHSGVLFDGNTNSSETLYFDSATDRRIRTYAGGYGPWTNNGPENNVWYFVIARFQSSSLARLICHNLETDTETEDRLGNIPSPSFTGITVGAQGGGSAYLLDGDIAELAVYNEATSDTKLITIKKYFRDRYV